jgi:5'(3')-deoxyribonucleotidase
MKIGIDCDGVLRDFIGDLKDNIRKNYPEHADKIKTPETWNWEDWLPFWTEEESEKYIFEDNYLDFFGVDANPIKSSVEDWPKLKEWAKEYGHELILVSAQRPQTKEPTEHWLQKWGFTFDEIIFTHDKWKADVDILVDDSPDKMNEFKEKSINNGHPICYKQTWNTKCHTKYMSIDRLSDLIGNCFG